MTRAAQPTRMFHLRLPYVSLVTLACLVACSGEGPSQNDPFTSTTIGGTSGGGSAFTGGAGLGGDSSGGGTAAGGNSSSGGAGPVDCTPLATAGYEVCSSETDSCGVIFTDSVGCTEVCAQAGLACEAAYENLDGQCAADEALPVLSCDSGHQSDYCVCRGALSGTGGMGTGGSSSDGSGGTGATDPELWKVTGFASVSGQGLDTTTGGGDLDPMDVTDCAALKTALSDDTARVLRVPEGTTLDCRTTGRTVDACELQCSNSAATSVFWRVPVGDQTCTDLADFNGDGNLDIPAGKLVSRPLEEQTFKIGSNKTLYGGGMGATILGVSFDIESKSNIIIRNLKIGEINPSLVEAGDGITVNSSHHVWIDHCELFMISDGYFDVRYGSTNVTLSHNHIVGKNSYVCGGQHHYISLADASDVTYHHNYFDFPSGRNPKVTSTARVHLYSNFYEGVTYFCASAGTNSEVLVEGNYYLDSNRPHWKDGGKIEASDNVYAGSTSASYRDGGDDVFAPPYSYTVDEPANLPTTIPETAGPGLEL